ncbi:MAG: JAB domain-containing protein [Anaerolineaceae bacterium]|nr:JAB domain-containing protein [Anaerolineaceae bacterium]
MRSFEIQKCVLVREKTHEYLPISDKVCEPEDLAKICRDLRLDAAAEEVVSLFCFNAAGMVTAFSEISHGDVCTSRVHPREIYKRALLNNAAGIALVHNHPSGTLEPSYEDKFVTRRIAEAGRLLGVELIEHLILTPDGGYYSLRENDGELFGGKRSDI